MQANWPTTGAAGGVVDDGPIVDVVVVDVDVEEVDVVVGVVVDVVVVVDVDVVEDDGGRSRRRGARRRGWRFGLLNRLARGCGRLRARRAPCGERNREQHGHDRVPQTSHERPRSHPAILPAVTPGGSSRQGVTAVHRSNVRRARSRP